MDRLNKQIDKLLDIIADSILVAKTKEEAAAVPLWPIPTPQGMLYWGNEWAKKLNQVLHLIDKQNISDEEIVKVIKFPSRIVHILWRTDAIKNSDLNKAEKVYVVGELLDLLKIFRKEDLFCDKGKNIIWTKKELEKHKKDLYFFSGKDKKLSKLISVLKATLYLYTELLYWANHPLGHCFHGVYQNKQGDLLIKDYFDLKPEVWTFSQGLNFSEVEIFEIYKRGTASKIKLEFFERGIRTAQSLKQDLEKFALKIDKKTIKNAEQISQFLKNLSGVIKKGSKFIQSLNKQQLIEKHAHYWFYILKPLCDLAGKDWCPPQAVYDNIYKRHKEINVVWEKVIKKNFEKTADLPYKQQEKILKQAFDPRN